MRHAYSTSVGRPEGNTITETLSRGRDVDINKLILKGVSGCQLDSSGLEHDLLAGFTENGIKFWVLYETRNGFTS
jgi:hypothetical protein